MFDVCLRFQCSSTHVKGKHHMNMALTKALDVGCICHLADLTIKAGLTSINFL